MNTHSDKTTENINHPVTKSLTKAQMSGESAFQFLDNRPETIAHRKLQSMKNNSAQLKQMETFHDIANAKSKDHKDLQFSHKTHPSSIESTIQAKWRENTILTPGVIDDNSNEDELDQWGKFTGDEIYIDNLAKQSYNAISKVLTNTKTGTSQVISDREHTKLMNKIYADIGRVRQKDNQVIKSFDVVWDRLNDRGIDDLKPYEHTSFVGRFTAVFRNEEDNNSDRYAFRQQVGHSSEVRRDLNDNSHDESDNSHDESDKSSDESNYSSDDNAVTFQKEEYSVDNSPFGSMEPDEESDLAGCYRNGNTLVTYDHPGNLGPFSKNDEVTYTFTSKPEIYNVETGEIVATHNPTTGTIHGKHPRVTISTP